MRSKCSPSRSFAQAASDGSQTSALGARISLSDVRAEVPLLGNRSQLLQRGGFDLTNALARQVERLAHFLERLPGAAVHSKAEAQKLLFARGQMFEQRSSLDVHALARQLFVRRGRSLIGHEVTKLATVAVVAQRGLQAKRFAHKPPNGPNLVERQAALPRELFVRWLSTPLLRHRSTYTLELVTTLEQVNRNSNGFALIGQSSCHRLAYPPRGIRRETMPTAPIEFLDGPNEAELALLHEIMHVEALAHETTRVRDDETEVGAHEFVHRALRFAPAPSKSSPGPFVGSAGAKSTCHSIEKRALEAFRTELVRNARTPTTAPLTSGLVAGRARRSRGSRPIQQSRESFDVRRFVGVLGRVSYERGGHDAPVSQLHRKSSQWTRGVSAAEQRLERVALTAFDALRKLYFFLVCQHPPSRRAGRRGGRRRVRVVRDGDVGESIELEGTLVEVLSRGNEGSARYVHGRLLGAGVG